MRRLRATLLTATVLLGAAAWALTPAVSAEEGPEPKPLGTCHLRDRGRIVALAFTADGQRLLSADADGSFVVREASTRKVLAAYSPVGSDALRFPVFAFAPSGERLYAAASGTNEVRVHDTKTGAIAGRLEKLEAGVRQIVISPDGKLLALRHEGAVSLIRLSDDGTSGTLARKHELGLTIGLCFSPDSKTLAASAKDGVFFYDTDSGKESRKKLVWHKKRDGDEEDEDDVHLGAHSPVAMAFSPDAKAFATAGGRSIRLWDLETNAMDNELEAEDFVGAFVFSPDGKRIASAGEDEKVHIWSLAKQKEIGKLEGHGDSVTCVAYSPDGKLLISGSKDCTIRTWNAKSGEEVEEFSGHAGAVRSLAFSKDGARIVSVGEDKRVIEWDVAAGKPLNDHEGTHAFYSPDGKLVATEHGKEIAIDKSGERIRSIETEEGLHLVGFAADGKQIVAYSDGTKPWALAYEAKDGEEVQRAKLGRDAVLAAALDPSRGFLYWVDTREAIRTLDLESGTLARLGERHAKDLAFSPDGTEIAILDPAGNLFVLDARTGEEKRALGAAEAPLVFGKGAVFAGGTLYAGETSRTFPGKSTAAAFSADGKSIAIGDAAGSVYIWALR